MHLKLIPIAVLALAVAACGTGAKRPSTPQAVKGETIEAPRSLPVPPPPAGTPPRAPEPIRPTRIADDPEENSVRLAEEDSGNREAVIPDPERSVYFPQGRTQVDDAGRALLRRLAERLRKDPDLVITLIGHADSLGSRSYSLAIAEERLDSVYQILRSQGVPRGKIRRVNPGRSAVDPACRSAPCRRLQRRVELVFAQ